MKGGGQIDPPPVEKTTLKKPSVIRVKERTGFPYPYFVLNFHIFQPYCSHISVLIFAGTYFGLIFRNIRKLIFENNTRFFKRDVFIRKSLGIVKIKKFSTNVIMLRFAP